jgi:hypothetical protein
MRSTLHWVGAILNERYRISYWEQVAKNEWWLSMMMEITKDKQRD